MPRFEILYQEECAWEEDFILNELFDDYVLTYINQCHIKENKVITPSEFDKVLVFTSNLHSYEEINAYVNNVKPTIVIHCSDEYGDKPQFDDIKNSCKLYLRQYKHSDYTNHSDITILPLGYGTGFLTNKWSDTLIKPINKRSLVWSFIGNIKSDRNVMIKEFSYFSRKYHSTLEIYKSFEVYDDSIFVPVGRGNTSLNCFRIYEALTAGAIPVVVGAEKEIDNTFQKELYENWVTAEDWNIARLKCSYLLDKQELLEMQKRNIKSWSNILIKIRSLINNASDNRCIVLK